MDNNKKILKFEDLLSSGLSAMIGVGVFVILTDITKYSKNYAWISMLIAGISVLFTTFSYAELASIYNSNLTEYNYIKEVSTEKIAIASYILISIADLLAISTVALGFGTYMSSLIKINPTLIATISLIAFNVINLLGTTVSVGVSRKILYIKLLTLATLIFFGFQHCNAPNLIQPNLEISPIVNGSIFALFSYVGFQFIINFSEESVHPETDVPKAMIYSVGIATAIYTLVTIISLMCLGSNSISHSSVPLADVSEKLFGQWGPLFLKLFAVIAIADTLLISCMAQSRSLSSLLSKIIPNYKEYDNHNTYNTPYISIAIMTIFSIFIVYFLNSTTLTAVYGGLITLITFVVVNLIAIILRFKSPNLKRGYTMPFNIGKIPIFSVLGMITSMYALYIHAF